MNCVVCGKRAPSQCSGCASVQYCSREHQTQHWKSHKDACRAIKAMKESGEGFIKKITKEAPESAKKPSPGETVTCHYTGTLLSGKEFDSSRTKNRPFSFPIGKSRVIRAWDEGVATMKVGEHARIVCSPDFGYGARGAGGVIPPNAYLVFDIELIDTR